MLIALGASLIATQGFAAPEVEQTYTRARQLCERLEDLSQLFPVLRGLWNCYGVRGELRTAHALSEQLLTLAQQTQDPVMLPMAHRAVGTILFYLGAEADAHTHFAQGITLYDVQQHHASAFLYGEDAGVTCRVRDAWALWCLGYPQQGLAQSHEAIALAQQMAHPINLSFAVDNAALLHQLRREVCAVQERAEATISLGTAQGLPYFVANGSILRGWTLTHQGQVKEGIEQMHQGLRAFRATGAELIRPYYLALLAEAHGAIGEPEAGLTVLAEALTCVDTTGERWSEPELYRLKGKLLLQQNSDNEAEAETVVYLYPAGNSVASKSGTIPPFHHLCEGALPWYPTSFSTS
jgi:predicted ATPase